MTKGVFLSAASILGIFGIASCSGSSLTAGSAPDGGVSGDASLQFPVTGTPLPCDVDAVLANNCRQCHTNPPVSGAPMPLLFQENLDAPANSDPSKKVYELVGSRIHDDARPMPQPPNARLNAADTKVLDDWIAQGAPKATTCAAQDGGAPAPDSGPPTLLSCTPDTHVAPTTAWTMPSDQDDIYACYGFDVTPAMKRHVIGIQPNIGNKTIVHHVLLFESDTAVSPTPTACDPGGSFQSRMIYGWAPGGEAMDLPAEAGFPEEGTTHYLVQVHYSNLNHLAGQTDTTGFDLCTTDQLRPNDADVLAFGTMKFDIPAHGSLDVTCNLTLPSQVKGAKLFSAFPHMHRLGKTIATTLTHTGGTPIDIGHQAAWDFNNELWFPITATVDTGDVVSTRCAWNNPGDTAVPFGTSTSAEMCYSFTAYYPKVQSAQWSWALPASASKCVTTP